MNACTPAFDPTLSSQFPASALRARAADMAGFQQSAFLDDEEALQATGWLFGACIRPGFSITTDHVRLRTPVEAALPSHDFLKLHIQLEGHQALHGPGIGDIGVGAGRMAYLVEAQDAVKNSLMDPGQVRAVTITCDRAFIAPLLAATDVPAAILSFGNAPATCYHYGEAPTPPAMRLIAEQLVSLRASPLNELLMEAKALELLYLWLDALSATPRAEAISSRNRGKAEALRDLLHTPPGTTMSITALSRELAWNETQMMESFKQLTGETISGYRQRLRMDRALAQLRDTDRTITDVAFEAGYEHPGNFATAFKRAFGLSPRVARGR